MSKGSGSIRIILPSGSSSTRTGSPKGSDAYYHERSRQLRNEVMSIAERYKGNPLTFDVQKEGFSGNFEVTKSDLKTIASKNTTDNKFNAVKNAMAKDIHSFIEKSKYIGWSPNKTEEKDGKIVIKHPESAYFVYFNRQYGQNVILCARMMKESGRYKPYAIINQEMFDHDIGSIYKTRPPK